MPVQGTKSLSYLDYPDLEFIKDRSKRTGQCVVSRKQRFVM